MFRDCLNSYISFKGRATRSSFNIFYMPLIVLCVLAAYLLNYFHSDHIVFEPFSITGSSLEKVITLSLFLIFVTGSSMLSRRLHDLNYSGWRQIISIFSIVLPLKLFFIGAHTDILIFVILGILIAPPSILINLIFLCAKRGTTGPNKYGTDPLQVTNIETTI